MRFSSLILILLVVSLVACVPPLPLPTLAPTAPATQPAFMPSATLTATSQPTSTSTLPVHISAPGQVALDFVARACEAQWSNNTFNLPCPGDPISTAQGFIFPTNYASIEGNLMIEMPMLVGLPGQGGNNGMGLFGRYPPLTVQAGDTFYSSAACQGDVHCEVEFALEYMDANGNYHAENNWNWMHKFGGGPFNIQVDLSILAGQTVEFLLVLRERGPAQDARVAWINPHIARSLDAQPNRPVPPETPAAPSVDMTPGVISGFVDVSTAPPYLNDPILGSSAVVVAFFNLDDSTYWYIQTAPNDPSFQMTVPPGNYQVAAYGRGVADLPYVAAGYTGENPSCGRELKTVTVEPNTRINDIVIADWNWTCGGSAARPDKPADIPVP